MDHVMVACGGPGERWDRYLGVPKPLIRIEGETLVARSVRLVRELAGERVKVFVVGNEPELEVPGAVRTDAHYSAPPCGLDKLCFQHWSRDGRTTVLWGDTYYTEAAMRSILSPQPTPFRFFGRNVDNDFTGRTNPEMYALVVEPAGIPRIRQAVSEARYLCRTGKMGGEEARLALWDVHLVITGRFAVQYGDSEYLTKVHDWTEDFDFPWCFRDWTARREAAGYSQEQSQYPE